MGVVTDEERALAEDEAMSSGEGVVDTLVTKGVVMQIQVSQAKAAQFGAEFIELAEQSIEDDVISSVPRSVAHQYKVVPLYQDDLSVTVAMSDPSDLDAIDAPTLVIAGAEDRIAPQASCRAICDAIPGGEIRLLDGIGHYLSLEDADLFRRIVGRFMDRHGGAAAFATY